MAAMLDQSLDAMIKETRRQTPKAKRNAKKSKLALGGKKKAAPVKHSNGPAPMAIGGVKKASGKARNRPGRSNAAMAMAIDGARGRAPVMGGKTKLMVGNLDYKVNDRDIKVRTRSRWTTETSF